jgi:glycosyltransferase involved in cell wall biosynthesis
LEAQCLGKYIISTDCPTGPKEILMNGKLGDLVKVGDYKKLASKILLFDKNKNKNFIKRKISQAKKCKKDLIIIFV